MLIAIRYIALTQATNKILRKSVSPQETRSSSSLAELPPEFLAYARRANFNARKLRSSGLAGMYRSSYRGSGMEFEDLREYRPGDDVRNINWRVTARTKTPFVKTFREERELNVLIALDLSSSTQISTQWKSRARVLSECGALLSLIALSNNDKVGLLSFSDRLLKYLPPKKSRAAVFSIIAEVLAQEDTPRRKTNLAGLLEFAGKLCKRRSLIFLLSDFIDSNYKDSLRRLSAKHEITAVWIQDPLDMELPQGGLIRIEDPESGLESILDLSSSEFLREYKAHFQQRQSQLQQEMRELGVSLIELRTDRDLLPQLQQFFRQKAGRG